MQKFGWLSCLVALLPFFGVAETYTLAGKDAAGASAMNGSGSDGWTDSSGVTNKTHRPSAGNDYVVDQPYCLRTPTTTAFTFAGDSLTLTGGAEMKVKIGSGGTVTIPNLIVAGEARISHGDGNQIKKIAGAIDIREDGEAFFDLSFDNPDGNARQFEILSTISGNGILRAGASDPVKSGTPWIKFSGSLADFTGPIVIRANGSAKLETYFQSSLPGDPDEVLEDGLTVAGNAALKFETSGKLGGTRGVSLGSGTCEIYVAAGQSVQIDGLLTGTAGFTKTGKGALALANVSPDLMGTVTVAEGVLQLCDASSRALPNATVSVASGAVLDEHGPVCGSDLRVVATLADVRVAEDGQPHGPVLTVTEPKAGYQVTWSVDGGDYTTDYPAFISPCEHTIDCRVFADGYLMQSLRATVVIGICRRIVATEAEKVGDWANATVAGDDASAAIQGVINGCGVGDRILVKAGTYLLSDVLSFASSLPSGITISSDDGAGNLAPRTTIFDGGSPAQTHRVFSIDAVNVTLKGITIRNGLQSGKDQNGGGVYVNANGFTVTNCIFDTCGAYNGGGLYWANKTVGGGVLDCVFTNCVAEYRGGGLYAVPENCAVRQTTFADCASTGNHGGGCFLEKKNWIVDSCLFTNCTANGDGGGIRIANAVGVLSNTTFTGCAGKSGPTVFSEGAFTMFKCKVVGSREFNGTQTWGAIRTGAASVIDSCYFSRNEGLYGTAAALYGGSVMTNCVFENQPRSIGYSDRGVVTRTAGTGRFTLRNCLFRNVETGSVVDENGDVEGCTFTNLNSSYMLGRSQNSFRNCLFTGCTNVIRTGNCHLDNCSFVANIGGPVIETADRKPTFTNCVFWANTPYTKENFRGNMGLLVYLKDFGVTNRVKMANCVFQSDQEPSTEAADIRMADKTGASAVLTEKAIAAGQELFAAPGMGDWHLRKNSPLVDGGLVLGWMTEDATDLDGKPRVVGMAPDVGCYERQGDEIDPPYPCIRAVAKEEDRTGVWTNAVVGLKEALAVARENEPGYMKAGTYDVTEPVVVDKWGVRIVGEGTDKTFIDGGNRAQTSSILSIEMANVTLQDLAIRNGSNAGGLGGGLYASKSGAGVVMTNCVVDSCTALRGGGAYFDAAFTLIDCTFTNCSTAASGSNKRGGGIYCGSDAAIRGVIDRCRFLSCAAVDNGSSCFLDAPCAFTDCLFARNGDTHPAWNCNSVIYSQKLQSIARCTFSTNVIGNSTLCVSLLGKSVVSDCVVENHPNVGKTPTLFSRSTGSDIVQLTGCRIRDTYANYIFSAGVNMDGCVLSNVTVRTSVDNNTRSNVRNCLFTGCPSPILIQSPVFENCTFAGNASGVALYNNSYSPVFTNCVFWANGFPAKDYYGSMGLYVKKDDFGAVNRVKMANCVLQSNEETSPNAPDMREADKTGATAILTAQAIEAGQKELLVAPSRGDVRPRAESPVVDAGVWCDWMTEDATDLAGKPRVVGTAPDVGCCERQGDEIDPPYPCTRAVAKEADKTGVWKDAFVGLPAALDVAYPVEPLYVKAGTYDVTEPVSMKTWGVHIVGEGPDQTVFDGGYPARTNRIFTIDEDNVTLSGLTIKNGRLKGKDQNGGGVYVNANWFTITNCVIDACGAYDGGGLYWVKDKSVGGGVLGCTFTNCEADHDGSGLYLASARSVVRGTTCADCAATQNGACYFGGADWVAVDCVFTNCTGSYGGGVRVAGSAHGVVTGSKFLDCGGKASGIALYSDSAVDFHNCRFVGNRDLNNNSQGVIRTSGVNVVDTCYFSRNQGNQGVSANIGEGSVMTNCVVEDQPKSIGNAGSGIVTRSTGNGRITVRDCRFLSVSGNKIADANADFVNCVFTNVYATDKFGGAQNYVRNSLFVGCTNTIRTGNCKFDNCSFVTNVGGAFVVKSWSPTYTNCVFWGNMPNREGKCRGNSGIQIESDDKTPESHIKLANCVLQTLEEDDPDKSKYGDVRLADPTGATTNLTAVVVRRGPKFVDPENGDWHLRQNSPLRDAALTLGWMTDDATDLDGKPRRISSDGKAYPDSLPDIGCYECDIPKPGFLLQVR